MNGDTLYSIGDLARLTGLTVKTIRFYSDRGIVPPAGRTPAGYRRFGSDAVARLDLVRTLRDLGLDLATIKRVVHDEVPLADVAAKHAAALAVQIRALRLRHAVLAAVARQGATSEEMDLMHSLARLSEEERRRLIDDFLDAVFAGAPEFAGVARSMTPDLPNDPDAAQVEAWVELAGLARDPDFRDSVRRMAEQHAADAGGAVPVRRDAVAIAREEAGAAVAAGVDPAAPEADRVISQVAARYARLVGQSDGPDLRRRLASRLAAAADPRRERYFALLSTINGWPPAEPVTPALEWCVSALRAA